MDVKENDVHRAARDIGQSVIDTVQTQLANATSAGVLQIEQSQLAIMLDIIKTAGRSAIESSTNVYMRAFTAHKKSAVPK